MKYFLFLLLIFSVSITNCTKPELEADENVIAKVGDAHITVQEFELNYEFGFANQKLAEDSRRAYLDKMIAELLLAQEGYHQKMDTSSSIRFSVETVRAERIIEEVFNTKVLANISVSEKEIRSEINKSVVSFQLKFLPAQSEPHARFLKNEVETKSYDQVLSEYQSEMMESPAGENEFTTPFMKAEEIDPLLLAEVTDLELNQISEPIFYNQQWFLFMVSNIKRQPLAPEDYDAKRDTYYKVLYNRKAMQGAETFVNDMMTPLNVLTKQEAFQPLAHAFYKWYLEDTPTGNLIVKAKKGKKDFHREIDHIFSKKLVEFGNTSWTVEEFLSEFNPGLYQLRPNDQRDFRIQFADVIGLVVRDYQLQEIAQKEHLARDSFVQKDIKAWENKWVFQAMRGRVLGEITFTDDEVEAFFEEQKEHYFFAKTSLIDFGTLSEALKKKIRKDYLVAQLKEYVKSLKEKYPVTIYEDKLAKLDLQSSQNNSVQQVQLFKQNSNRMAFPVVDPSW